MNKMSVLTISSKRVSLLKSYFEPKYTASAHVFT